MEKRIPWANYFMEIAFSVAKRSTCTRRQVGAVAVKDKRILATGYNGAPAGVAHCLDIGCLRDKLKIQSGERHELCRAIHAEQNIIIQAATYGVSILEADIYCTTFPCFICSKMLINAGIKSIYYSEYYPDEFSKQILDEANVHIEKINMDNR